MSIGRAFGSCPGHPGKYALYVSRHEEDDTQCMVQVFASAYAARKFLDVLLADDGYVWDDECTIRSETGIVVSTRWFPDAMRRAIDHTYTAEEKTWDLRDPHRAEALAFRCGPNLPRTDEDVAALARATGRAPRAASTPRASRAGLTSIGDIAEALGVEPRVARGALRQMKIEKPAAGWAWGAAEAEQVQAKLRDALGKA